MVAALGLGLALAGCSSDEEVAPAAGSRSTGSVATEGATTTSLDGASGAGTSVAASGSGANRAPTISGAPAGSVAPGNTFIFVPTARDQDNDLLSFSVANLPAWARFDAFTGQVSGTPGPAEVGTSGPITITVSDGRLSTALAPFTITVSSTGGIVGAGTRSATIAWQPPTQNTDGTTVGALASYKIHYGSAPGSYTNVVAVNNPGLTRYVVENLVPGTYFIAMTAVAADGLESDYSAETVARLN